MGKKNIFMGSNNSPFFFEMLGVSWLQMDRIYSIFFLLFYLVPKLRTWSANFKDRTMLFDYKTMRKSFSDDIYQPSSNLRFRTSGRGCIFYCMISELDTHTINNIGILSQALVWCMTLRLNSRSSHKRLKRGKRAKCMALWDIFIIPFKF